MPKIIRREIRDLRALYWSERDPEGRAFAPLADALRRAGDLEPAVELLLDGLSRLPDFVSGHVVAGWVHRAREATIEAEEAFLRALELDEGNVSALRGLGLLLADRGDKAGALVYFRRLDEEEPGDPEVQAQLAQLGLSPEDVVVDVAELAPDDLVIVPIESLAPDGAPPSEGEPETGDRAHGVEGSDEAVTIAELAPAQKPAAPPAPPVAPAVDAPRVPSPSEREVGEHLTRTMAELYASQGLAERALRVYDSLIEAEPDDRALLERRDELLASLNEPESTGPLPEGAGDSAHAEELELLAEHMTDPSDANEELDSPFAWTREPDEEPPPREGPGSHGSESR